MAGPTCKVVDRVDVGATRLKPSHIPPPSSLPSTPPSLLLKSPLNPLLSSKMSSKRSSDSSLHSNRTLGHYTSNRSSANFSLVYTASPAPSGTPSLHGENGEETVLTLRALVSTKEAGIIIGKGGKNVAELRDVTGVKAGVTKVIQGVHERVLTVSGSVEGVAKVCSYTLNRDVYVFQS